MKRSQAKSQVCYSVIFCIQAALHKLKQMLTNK